MNEHDKKQRRKDVIRQISKGTGIATVALPGLMGMDSGVTALRDSLKENPNFVKSLKHHSKGIGKMMLKSMPSSAVCGVLGTGIGVALAGKPKSKREKSASAMIDEHFEKVALFGLGKNKSNPNKTKETWIDGVDVEDYDKHVNTAKLVYSKAKANNHLTQSGLNALEQSNTEGSTPFQWIGSRDFTDGNADTYINEYRSLMNKSAFDIVNDSFEKVAKLSQEELAWQAIDIMNSDDDRRMDDDQFEALQAMRRINPNFGDDGLSNIERNLISSLNTNKPIKYNNLKFKHVANDWVKDGNIKNTPFTNYNKHDVVFGWNDRVHTKDKHKFGTSYVLKSPTKDKYYLAQYDNDVPEGYDLSRINDNMKVLQLSQGVTNKIKEKGFIR